VAQFDQWRRSASTAISGPLEDAFLVLEAERANPAEVIDGEQEVDFVQWPCVDCLASLPRLLSSLAMVAQDDAPGPTVGLCVGDDRVEYRPTMGSLVELRPTQEGQRRIDRVPISSYQPSRVIVERRAFPRTLDIVAKDSDLSRSLP
jgi:hypothetical protein